MSKNIRSGIVEGPWRTGWGGKEKSAGYMLDFCGWGNGYVRVEKGHPWYEKPYDDIDVEVNGGPTYSSHWNPIERVDDENGWWVGFDTAHAGDSLEKWPKEAVEKEAERLRRQAEAL